MKKTAYRATQAIFVIISIAGLLVANVLLANDAEAAKQQLDAAITQYNSADYNMAIKSFSRIANDETVALEARKTAFQYLGRCYIARRLSDKAKDAVLELLELEPPIIEFDPDVESPPMMKVYYEARKEIHQGSYQLEQADPGIKTIAVIDFQNSSTTNKQMYDPMEKGLADLFINRLNGSTHLKVVERERLQWILNELDIQNQYDMEGAVRAGKQLGVHVILLGSFILVKDELWLSARLVKVESSEVLLSQEVKGNVKNFFELTDKLTGKIARAIDEDLAYAATGNETAPNSLEAMMAYSEGLALLDKSNYEEAYQKFQQALEFDPGYKRARQKANSIKSLIAYSGI